MFSTAFLHTIRENELQLIEAHLNKKSRILEIGGGTGLQAKILSEKGYDVTSIDIAQSNYVNERIFPVIDYDGANIPFPDNNFDIILSSNTLEHVRDIMPFLAETSRVLKPNGYCIHVMPSGTWRFWTSLTHYLDLLQRIIRSIPDVFPRSVRKAELVRPARWSYNLLRNILIPNRKPMRHGEAGNFISETYLFSRHAWKTRFKKAHFHLDDVKPMGLFYTGYMLLGPKLPLKVRHILAKFFGSACILYKSHPLAESKAQTTPVNYNALAEHFRPYSMVHPSGIAFAAEEVINLINQDIPGVILECGTWRGGCSMAMMEAQRKTFGHVLRHLHMLDSYEGLPPATEKDGSLAFKLQAPPPEEGDLLHNNCSASEEGVRKALAEQKFTDKDVSIHKGWFADTVPPLSADFKKNNTKISLLRLDGDWYDSTMVCLEHLEPLVSENGIIILDDYYAWDGCARAVHDYLSKKDLPYRIKSLSYFFGAYMVKKSERSDLNEF